MPKSYNLPSLHVVALWNAETVLDGHATATMAYDIARGFLAESFAGADHKAWREGALLGLLQPLLSEPTQAARSPILIEWRDETGAARVMISREG